MGIFSKLVKQPKNEANFTVVKSGKVDKNDLIALSDMVLLDTKTDITTLDTISIPIGEMATLGGAVASLLPALRTVTQTTTLHADGLFRLANAGAGDALKVAKNGNFWGALKTANGGSKFAQFASAGPLSATSQAVMPIDPATMMMAVALYSIEQKLGKIEEMEKQIVSFLYEEKESQIEGDLKTLVNILQGYKYNWEDEKYKISRQKLVLDILRSANQNMIFYQKQVADVQKESHTVVGKTTVNTVNVSLQKKLKYYRLSLYIYSLASFVDLMLREDFKEENITMVKNDIEKYSIEYRETFATCSAYLETMAHNMIGKNALKGLGNVENALGNLIGNIPLVKDGQVDEWLVKTASRHKEVADKIEHGTIEQFSVISDPETSVFIERLEEMNRIYNHTEQIFFDDKRIYLVAG